MAHGTRGAGREGGYRGEVPSLNPAVAEIRRAVRAVLADRAGERVIVALSGGADSLALAAAAAHEAAKAAVVLTTVTVDHGLQAGSGEIAARAAEQARALGAEAIVVQATVERNHVDGPEAAARDARYAQLERVAAESGATAILLGHTRDDQAETVLLGLARGSGAASLMGMAPSAGLRLRPLLDVSRETTQAACVAEGLDYWNDPHNVDPSYARVRVRRTVLPTLEAELGPGMAEALARTAEQLREDHEAFQEMIDETIEDIVEPAEAGIAISVSALAANPAALRNRIIRHVVASEFHVSLTRVQTLEVARLATDWRGQGPIDLPACEARREAGKIVISARS